MATLHTSNDQTECLIYWPLLRKLSADFLTTVNRFYHHETSVLLVTFDDRVYTFGRNPGGRLGLGHEEDVDQPTEIEEMRHKRIAEICFESMYVMALTTDGDLYGWGYNEFGQVGCGNTKDQTRPVLVQQSVQSVRCGWQHTASLDRDGTVWCWGRTDQRNHSGRKLVPTRIDGLPTVERIECGQCNCVALTTQGDVYIWGYLSPVSLRVPTQVTLPTGFTVISLAPGWEHFWTVGQDGRVLRWHFDEFVKTLEYEQIKVGEPVRTVVSRRWWADIACFVTNSGRIVVWHWPGQVMHTSLTSLPDAFALYAHYPSTPFLTTLVKRGLLPSTIDSFNDPSQSDLTLIFQFQNEDDYFKPIYLCTSEIVHRSGYLKKQVESEWKDESEVLIESYSYWVYWAYLRYVLCEVFKVETDWVHQLLDLAIQFNEDKLVDRCLDYLDQFKQNRRKSVHLEKTIELTTTSGVKSRESFKTNELSHWFPLRELTVDLLEELDQFYVYKNGTCALLVTKNAKTWIVQRGDLVPTEIEPMQGKSLREVEWDGRKLWVITTNNELFTLQLCDKQTTVTLVRQNVKSVKCGHHTHIVTLDLDGTVCQCQKDGTKESGDNVLLRVEELSSVIQVCSGLKYFCALTKQSLVFVWGEFGHCFNRINPAKPLPLAADFEVTSIAACKTVCLVLTRNGELYCCYYYYHTNDQGDSLRFQCSKVQLDQPIAQVVPSPSLDIACLVTTSSLVTVWRETTGHLTETSLTSVPDVCALYSNSNNTPTLTQLSSVAIQTYELLLPFNNPLSSDFTLILSGQEENCKIIYIDSSDAKSESIFLQKQLENDWKDMRSVTLDDTYPYWVYWAYVRFLFTEQLVVESDWVYQLLALSIRFGEIHLRDAITQYLSCQHRVPFGLNAIPQKLSTIKQNFHSTSTHHRTESIVNWPLLRTMSVAFLNTLESFFIFRGTRSDETSAFLFTTDSRAYALGVNEYGKLGVGHEMNVDLPTEIEELRDKRIVEIASGGVHVLALTIDGDLFGWGWNQNGQVGCEQETLQTRPELVKRDVQKVRCGLHHTAALDRDGSVWCWGGNDYGQLGRLNCEDQLVPARVKGLLQVESIECGEYSCVALTTRGEVFRWGEFASAKHFTPTLLTLPSSSSSGLTITSLAARHDDLFTLTQKQTVFRWYYDHNENLQVDSIEVDEPVRAVVSSRWKDIVCLVTYSGRVVVWHEPEKMIFTSLTSVSDAFVLYGQHGDTPYLTSLPPSAIDPQLLRSIDYFHDPSKSDFTFDFDYKAIHVCVARIMNQQSVCECFKYQMEILSGNSRAMPISSYPYWVYWAYLRFLLCGVFEVETDWVGLLLQLATENSNSALRNKCLHYLAHCNRVQVCHTEQASLNTDSPQLIEHCHSNMRQLLDHITQDSALISQVDQLIASPSGESCFARTHFNNKMYAIGKNDHGQLGIGHRINSTQLVSVEMIDCSKLVQIEWGQKHVMSLNKDGDLYGWGRNDRGQVDGDRKVVHNLPVKVKDSVRIVRCGHNHSAVITTDGKVYCWGDNRFGQLGQNSQKPVPGLRQITAFESATLLECGPNNCVVLTQRDQLWVWGQFGATVFTSPKQVSLPNDVSSITSINSTRDHFLLLSSSGDVYCGHFDYSNQSLQCDLVPSPAPVHSIFSYGNFEHYLVLITGKVISWSHTVDIDVSRLKKIIKSLYKALYGNEEYVSLTSNNLTALPNQRGFCLVLNYEIFDNSTVEKREGSQFDVTALKHTFERFLQFELVLEENLTFEETKILLQQICDNEMQQFDLSIYSPFVLCLLSHGNETEFYCRDQAMKMKEVFDLCNKCQELKRTPKLFFISKCQGNRFDYGVPNANKSVTNNDTESDETTVAGQGEPDYVPSYADNIVFNSTYEGFKSLRHPKGGTIFIQTLCQVIELACDGRQVAVLDLCTRVTKILNMLANELYTRCQQATFQSTLHDSVLLGPGVTAINSETVQLKLEIIKQDELI